MLIADSAHRHAVEPADDIGNGWAHITVFPHNIEFIVLVGFIFIIVFLLSSVMLIITDSIYNDKFEWKDSILVFFGVLCFIMLLAEKVMVDEIGRELKLGWEVVGELIILSLLMILQMIYSILVMVRYKPK